jgi:hypothetical protein
MNYAELVSQPWRLPLTVLLSSFLLAGATASWRIDAASKAETRLEQTRRERLNQAELLAKQLATQDEVSAGIAILHKIRTSNQPEDHLAAYFGQYLQPAAGLDKAATTSQEDKFWTTRTIRLSLEILHEGHLLDALNAWRKDSPGLHQVRACRIERMVHALQADCELVRLTPPEGLPQ